MKRKKDTELERFCKFCEKAEELRDGDKMLCRFHGIVSAGYCCRAFRYDPLKRVPAPPHTQQDNARLSFDFVDV